MKAAILRSAFAATTALVFLAGPAPAQSFDFESYLRRTWKDPSRLSVQKFMVRAERDGHLRSPRDRARAKRAWGSVVLGGRRLRLSQLAASRPWTGVGPSSSIVLDREYNNTFGFADDAAVLTPAGLQLDGTISANGNTDCYRLRTVQDGVVQLQLTGLGSAPIPYGDIGIYNEKGYVVRAADGSVTTPAAMRLELPRGQYFVIVDAPSVGGYRLDCRFTTQAIAALPISGTTNVTLPAVDDTLFRVTLPSDGVLRLTIRGGTLDSYLVLQSSILSYMFDVDDDSTSSGMDAGLNAQLAKGVYYLSIGASLAGPVVITTTFTPKPVPPLSCNAAIQGTIPGGQEDFHLYRVTLTAAQEVQFKILGRGTSAPITDSFLFVFDVEGNEIMESDDDWAFVGSIAAGTLPAASYFAASTGYWDKGDYTISTTCAAPVSTRAAPGTTTSSVIPAKDGHVTFLCDLGTTAGLEFQVFENSLPDAMLGIVDAANGLAMGWDDDTLFGLGDSEVANRFARGSYHVLIKDYCGDDGSFDLTIGAPKLRESPSTQLRGLGKNGDFAILIVSAKTIPGLAFAQFGGLFQLDLGVGFVVGAALIPADGQLDFGFKFPTNSGAILQSLHLNVTTLAGDFTNILR